MTTFQHYVVVSVTAQSDDVSTMMTPSSDAFAATINYVMILMMTTMIVVEDDDKDMSHSQSMIDRKVQWNNLLHQIQPIDIVGEMMIRWWNNLHRDHDPNPCKRCLHCSFLLLLQIVTTTHFPLPVSPP
jgi:hypothetical protein